MSNKLVSVVIPSYNHQNYIEEAIKSIISQTYKNIELIIIDDGSTDSTWNKIKRYENICKKRFTNTDLSTKKNEGTATTLNKLVAKANGDYIYLMASDDIAKPHAIEKMVSRLEQNTEAVLAVGDNEIIDKNSKPISWDKKRKILPFGKGFNTFREYLSYTRPDIDFNGSDFGSYQTFLRGNYIPNGYLIRKNAMDNYIHYTPKAPLEDWYLHLQLSKIGKYLYINEILFSYRWHESNTIQQTSKIKELSKQTFLYEKEILQNEKFKNFAEIYHQYIKTGKKKTCFKLGNLLEIYRCKSPLFNKKYLRILNKTWCISYKSK